MFLLTDNQIVREQFLVYINDLLSTGLVADLFTQEDRDGFINAVRSEVKAQGILDTPEACWEFFLAKARRLLHVVLCFSPVGDKFRVRARQFPALVNCTQFDWFHGWPREALVSVAQRFLASVPDVEPAVRDQLVEQMAHAHTAVRWGGEGVGTPVSARPCCCGGFGWLAGVAGSHLRPAPAARACVRLAHWAARAPPTLLGPPSRPNPVRSAASAAYLETQRRYNYTTPKSYLELISLYKDLLARKRRVGGRRRAAALTPTPGG